MATRNKTEASQMPLHHRFSLLDPLRDFDFLVSGQQWNLPHLLKVHPHRVIQNINLRCRSTFFLLFFVIDIFFAIPVAIHLGGLDDVDLQAA